MLISVCNALRFAEYPPLSAMGKETILLIEDDESIQELVRYHLCREGYQVFSASSAAEALELVNKEVPDLILLDLMLPRPRRAVPVQGPQRPTRDQRDPHRHADRQRCGVGYGRRAGSGR